MKPARLVPGMVLWLLLSVTALGAQAVCAPLIMQALSSLDTACAAAGANQACYGFFSVSAQYSAPEFADTFDSPADIVDIDQLTSLTTAPYDPTTDAWGVALLRLRANVPGALPGQVISMLLTGGANLTDASASVPDAQPMQAFSLSTSTDGPRCTGVPPSSLTIQSPRGLNVTLNVNGVDFTMGSTVNLRSDETGFRFSTLAGHGAIGGHVIPVGYSVQAPINADGVIDVEAFAEAEVEIINLDDLAGYASFAALPDDVLDEPWDLLTPEELALISAIDFDWLTTFDPYVLGDMITALAEAGIDPADLDDIGLDDFTAIVLNSLTDAPPGLIDAYRDQLAAHADVIYALEAEFGTVDADGYLTLTDAQIDSFYTSYLADLHAAGLLDYTTLIDVLGTDFGFNMIVPGFGTIDPGFDTTGPGFGTIDPGFDTITPGFNSTDSGFGTTNPGFDTTTPGFNSTDSGIPAPPPDPGPDTTTSGSDTTGSGIPAPPPDPGPDTTASGSDTTGSGFTDPPPVDPGAGSGTDSGVGMSDPGFIDPASVNTGSGGVGDGT